jgi:protein-S-isoprenylcysteine O-methyltransferase Ste14
MAACAIALFGTITWQLRRIDPLLPVSLPPWVSVGGIVHMAAGTVLGFATFGLFAAGRALSPHAHFPDPAVLITWGPYKFVRNPMAKALFTVLCGRGFFLLSSTVLLFALAHVWGEIAIRAAGDVRISSVFRGLLSIAPRITGRV